MRILIIKPSSLGDAVHALPTVNLIRRRFPDAHIAWLINNSLASLLKNCQLINERIEFRREEFKRITHLPRFLGFLQLLREHNFDLVVDLQGLLRSGLMTAATRAPRRVGLSDAREGALFFYTDIVPVTPVHAVERYLCAAKHLGCDAGPVEFPLGSSAEDTAYIDKLLLGRVPPGPLIAVNAATRWPTKLWGDEKFAALIQKLPRERVVLTGGAADVPRANQLCCGCINIAGKTNLAQLAELFRRCAVVISNDSGPMHLAAAVGTPVVAVFGPTDPALTGPYGNRHVVLRSGIPCSPCMKPRCAHKPRMECMTLVTVEQVLAAVHPFL
jgi:lipopolysaccharide heptosyltransferase I